MFEIGNPSEIDIFPLIGAEAAPVVDAIIRGLKADRLVQKNLVDFEELSLPSTAFAFKITYPHDKDRASIIQLSDCGRCLKVHLETSYPLGSNAAGYEFKFHPTNILRNAIHDDITAYSNEYLFLLAFCLLKLSDGYDFEILQDGKKLDTDSPIVALYEACIDDAMRSTALTYGEPDIYEDTERTIRICKDTGIAEISGCGVTSMCISLTNIFTSMLSPALEVAYLD